MQLRIVLIQFWRDLKAQRLRTALTLFGLAWGTFCVVLLLAFGEGVSREMLVSMTALGERNIIIWGSRTSMPFEGLARGRRIALEDSDADAILRLVPAVVRASPEYSDHAVLKGPKGEPSAGIAAVRPCFGPMRMIEPSSGGRFLNDRDEAERRRVVFLGDQVRQDLFSDEQAVGRTIEIRGIQFLVIGTLPKKPQDSSYSGRDDNKIFIPASVAVASFGQRWPDNMVVEIEKGADAKEALKEIRAVLGKVHHFDPADEEALMTWDVGEMVQMFHTLFLGFRMFLGILGVLTLAVAGIGVSNIMSMVVEDRTSQIGISMAIGARKRWILSQILLETLLVVGLGGTIGVLLALGVVKASGLITLPEGFGTPVFSWQTAVVTAGLLSLIGIVSGMGPARRAAGLNPAVALRS
ncbi:MAG: FtsX-like permease family protein [Candidatus Eisenbacteria bacterium]|nr:FtsX-like permease family protein [Candidatus Eisenbacteria bacterium]